MLNEKNKGSVGSMPSSLDLFSLVTEANIPNHTSSSSVHNESIHSNYSTSANDDDADAFGRGGTLILEGEEQASKSGENTSSDEDKFTVPESVYLPSEIGTLEGQSGSSNNEQDSTDQGSSKGDKSSNEDKCTDYFLSEQLFAHGVATFVVVITMLSLTTWRSLVWKSEAMHLKEVVRQQNAHHSSLDLKIASLEADLLAWNRRHKDPHNWKFQKGNWEIDDEDDDVVLSFKNCYLEASIGLGECSRKWQEWLTGKGGDSDDDDCATDEDGFTEDMTRLVHGLIDGVTAASSNSISFVEKTMKQMSEFYSFGDDFNSSDTDIWNENEISKALSNAIKKTQSAVGEATTVFI